MKLPSFEDFVKSQRSRPLRDQKWHSHDDSLHLWTRLDLAFPHKVHTVSFACSFKYHCLVGSKNRECFIHIAESSEKEAKKKKIIFSSPCAERDWTDLKFDFEVNPGKKYSLWYQMGGGGGHRLCVRNASVKNVNKMNRSKSKVAALKRSKGEKEAKAENTDETPLSNPFAGGGIAAAAAKVAVLRRSKQEKEVTNENTDESPPSNPFAGGGIAAAAAKVSVLRRSMQEKEVTNENTDESPPSNSFSGRGVVAAAVKAAALKRSKKEKEATNENTDESPLSNPFAAGGIAAAAANFAVLRRSMQEKEVTNENTDESPPTNPFAGGGIAAAKVAALKRSVQEKEVKLKSQMSLHRAVLFLEEDDTTSDPTDDTNSVEHEAKHNEVTRSDCTSDTSIVDEAKMNLVTMEELTIAQNNALLHTLRDQVWDDPDDTPRQWTRLDFAFPNKVHYVSFTCSFKYQGDGNCKGMIQIVESPEEEDGGGAEKTFIYSSPCAEDDWTDLKCDFEVKSKKKYSLWYKMGGGNHDELHVRDASVRKMNLSKFEALESAKPLRSSYYFKEETVFLGEEVPLEYTANGASYRPMDVELRGITLRQLRELRDLALRLCLEEAWYDWKGNRVTPESMNLYDVVKYIVKPFTEATGKSFVESLPSTAGTQPPHWFMSHWWGEPFPLTMDCLEEFIQDFRRNYYDFDDAQGGGMTIDTPIWICAFANNQWDLNEDMADDPKKSSFAKAMGIACFRTVSVLDANGEMLTRLWCNYEQYLVHILAKKKGVDGLMTFYTAHRYKHGWKEYAAVGIVPGRDCKYFPFHRIFNALPKIDIRTAGVSVAADGRLIKNSVAGMHKLDAEPPADHENFDILNNSVKASLVYPPAVLNAAHEAGREVWDSTLKILSKGTMTGKLKLDFSSFERRLTSMEARELVCHVPLTCTGLDIWYALGDAGEGAIEGLLEWVKKKEANSLTYLKCCCKVWDDEKGRAAGSRLAAALASNHAQSMEKLSITDTDWIDSGNVSDWASALEKMSNLKKLWFDGRRLSKEEHAILKNATHAEDVHFLEGLHFERSMALRRR